jgi:hypothetical protein
LNNQVRQENDRRKREEDRLKFTLWKKMDGEGPGLFQTARKKTILERRWHIFHNLCKTMKLGAYRVQNREKYGNPFTIL